MIGAVKAVTNSASGGGGGSPLAGFITPALITRLNGNGTYVSPNITANAQHGTPPYTYEWSIDNPDFSLSSTTDQTIKFTVSGYNTEKAAVLTCTITDAALTTVAATCNITVLFESFEGDLR